MMLEMKNETYADWFAHRIASKQMTPEKFAQAMNVHVSTVKRWLDGGPPSKRYQEDIVNELGFPPMGFPLVKHKPNPTPVLDLPGASEEQPTTTVRALFDGQPAPEPKQQADSAPTATLPDQATLYGDLLAQGIEAQAAIELVAKWSGEAA